MLYSSFKCFISKITLPFLFRRFISDLVVVIVSATCGGIAFACAGQPVSFSEGFRLFFLILAISYSLMIYLVLAVPGVLLMLYES